MGSASSIEKEKDESVNLIRKNRQIEQEIDAERRKLVLKLLLLGPGNSGKSTTLKQLRIIHDSGFSDSERLLQRSAVYNNMLASTIDLVNSLKMNGVKLSTIFMKHVEIIIQFVHAVKVSGKDVDMLPDLICFALDHIANDIVIMEAVDHVTMVDSNDNALYFFKDIKRIISSDFIPTADDILRSRTPTAGVVQYSIVINKYTFKVVDVGGQKTQRRKWIHVFDNVNAVLFITSLSDYNETLVEDSKINRMVDSIALFSDICNSPWFNRTAMILFLNKIDLFEKKITRIPISVALRTYKGKQEYRPSLDYITRKFKQCNKNPDRKIYVHETCATDTRQVEVVINMVVTMVIDTAMQQIGLQ